MREPGFYWVKYLPESQNDWTIGEYSAIHSWFFQGIKDSFEETDLMEIDERRIVREEKEIEVMYRELHEDMTITLEKMKKRCNDFSALKGFNELP